MSFFFLFLLLVSLWGRFCFGGCSRSPLNPPEPRTAVPMEASCEATPYVWVHSPSRLISEALGALLQKAGFEPLVNPPEATEAASREADIIVCDLRALTPPFPPPQARGRPTLALVSSAEAAKRGALDAGYRGYLAGEESADALREALQAVLRGEVWAGGIRAERSLPDTPPPPLTKPLTKRETQVLALLVQGLPNKHIARRLGLAERTVKGYVSALLYIFGVGSRAALIAQRGRDAWFRRDEARVPEPGDAHLENPTAEGTGMKMDRV